jgi:hypothetical protein
VRRLVRKLEREAPGPIHVFYEAGLCGYALPRQVTTSRVSCEVVAPALIPRKPGERVKTNRRDARKLAELGRAGLLTPVQPPTPEDEAVRDLARARDDAREDLQRCRHRLGKLLLRRGLHYQGRNGTRAHREWIHRLTWTHDAERIVVDDYLMTSAVGWPCMDNGWAVVGSVRSRRSSHRHDSPVAPTIDRVKVDTSAGLVVAACSRRSSGLSSAWRGRIPRGATRGSKAR